MKRRALLANALLAAASLVVFGGAAELLARRFDLRPAGGAALVNPPWMGDRVFLRPDYRDEMAKHGVLARYYDLYEWDRFLFYRLRPKANVELLDPFAPPDAIERSRWSVQTNASGFRGPDFELAKRPGTIRVLALGDSSTFGWGVEHFETYPQRLAAALAERLGRPRDEIEVLNLGVPGYSSFQGRVLLERVALALEPDVIVWSYLSNDGAVTGASDAATYAERLGARGALLEVLHTSRAFETLEAWILVARRTLRPPPEPDPREASHRNIASYAVAAANVRAAVAAARGAGVPIVLLAQCVGGEPAQVLAAVARETGAPHLDAPALLRASLPALATEERYDEHRAGLRRRYGAAEVDEHILWLAFLPDRCHPNALGHRLVAESLADLVTDALRAARP